MHYLSHCFDYNLCRAGAVQERRLLRQVIAIRHNGFDSLTRSITNHISNHIPVAMPLTIGMKLWVRPIAEQMMGKVNKAYSLQKNSGLGLVCLGLI